MLSDARIIGKVLILTLLTASMAGCFGRSTKIQAPTAVSYPTAEWVLIVGEPVVIAAPLIEGDAADHWSVEPALPAGLSLDSRTGVISGTPTEVCPSNFFTVTATNFGGGASVSLEIRVNHPAPCNLAYSPDEVLGLIAFTDFPVLEPALECGPSNDYSVDPALPEGVQLDPYTGIISGVPVVSQQWTLHQITAANETGSTSFTIAIEILPAGPCDLEYVEDDEVIPPFTAMDPILPGVGCGEPDIWEIDPPLPGGLEFDTATGSISGTPVVETDRIVYTITALNEHGSDQVQIALRISPVFSYQLQQIGGEYDPATGEGGAEIRVVLTEGGDNVTFPTQIMMISLALGHDTERMDLVSVEPGQDLTDLNGGNGPEFFAPFETPTGFTLGVVFSFSAEGGGISAELPREVAVLNYETNPDAFEGDQEGQSLDLEWGNPSAGDPGVPSVGNTVVLDGVTGILPVTENLRIDLIPN
ncbi:MAG: Ig domain-containing protein [Planctomycetota bacterium]|nr:Ig domain-containing protein [Planctomycetota bacterium]